MNFKTHREKEQFDQVSLILQLITFEIEEMARCFGKDICITRVFDPVAGESGVHLDKRALDIRDEFNGIKTFSEEEIDTLIGQVNMKWARNDGKKTVIHHQFQGGPYHLHVQIPVSTKVYEKQK